MNNFLVNISYWHWIGLAAIVFITEILTGTGFLLWVGLSATLVGLLLFVFGSIGIAVQLFVFAPFSIVAALLWKLYLHFHPTKTDRPKLNRRAEQYIGREFTLREPIVNGMGKVHVDDTMWQVKCNENWPKSTLVRVVGAEGVFLLVEQVDIRVHIV